MEGLGVGAATGASFIFLEYPKEHLLYYSFERDLGSNALEARRQRSVPDGRVEGMPHICSCECIAANDDGHRHFVGVSYCGPGKAEGEPGTEPFASRRSQIGDVVDGYAYLPIAAVCGRGNNARCTQDAFDVISECGIDPSKRLSVSLELRSES